MLNKRVSWYTLERITLKKVEFARRLHYGHVRDVSSCGIMCLVVDDAGNKHTIETCEIEEI